METFITHSEAETANLAVSLLSRENLPNLICLTGELGAGKTAFVRGLAISLGVTRLTSPTFVIQREYQIEHPTYHRLYHLDFYRLDSESDIKGFDLAELVSDPHNLVLVEWAHKQSQLIIFPHLDITITLQEDSRHITIQSKQ